MNYSSGNAYYSSYVEKKKEADEAAAEEAKKKKEEEEKKNKEMKSEEAYANSYIKAKEKWYYYNSSSNGKASNGENVTINEKSIIQPDSKANVEDQIGNVSEEYIRKTGEKIIDVNGNIIGNPTVITEKNFSNQSGVLSTYISLSFLTDSGWKTISTKNNNYIVNLEINDDGGGQKATINLVDRDFNQLDTYINSAIKNGQIKNSGISQYPEIANSASITTDNGKLDAATLKKYREVTFIDGVDGSYAKDLIDGFNTFSKEQSQSSAPSADTKRIIEEKKKEISDLLYNSRTNMDFISIVQGGDDSIIPNLKINFGYADENYSGWSTDANKLNDYQKDIGSSGSDARWNEFNSSEELTKISGGDGVKRSLSSIFNQYNQSIINSASYEFYITGMKSSVTSSGINYEINAISVPKLKLSKFRVVARNAIYKGTPKKLIYTLFKLFNDSETSNLKLFWIDRRDIREEDEAGNAVDVSKYTDSHSKLKDGHFTSPSDVTSGTSSIFGLSAADSKIKKVSLHLGNSGDENNGIWDAEKGEYNYSKTKSVRTISIASVFDELCAQCPTYKDDSTQEGVVIKTKDVNGDEVKAVSSTNAHVYRMAWRVIGTIDKTDSEGKTKTYILVGFYYNNPTVFDYLRKYSWGPAFKGNTVVKSVSLENEQEFALLSAQSINDGKTTTMIKNGRWLKSAPGQAASFANNITGLYNEGKAYGMATYKGDMQIVGDPGYAFGNILIPYSYPIYVSIQVPRNTSTESSTEEKSAESACVEHYTSGVYVVSNIKHNISASGFTTTLSLMSYPGLSDQIMPYHPKS